ncbi:hypothetical protein EVAR_95104_1 [Eumeta japonica]|uniref:Uncharacterized protein n=1 Tax=Eumeta variegata TaxID=151549 RepID=A0A4C1W7Y8_EUMVA|nr:hypothetical protein EVAR_95104_1 [Eumeta japonica]
MNFRLMSSSEFTPARPSCAPAPEPTRRWTRCDVIETVERLCGFVKRQCNDIAATPRGAAEARVSFRSFISKFETINESSVGGLESSPIGGRGRAAPEARAEVYAVRGHFALRRSQGRRAICRVNKNGRRNNITDSAPETRAVSFIVPGELRERSVGYYAV